MASIGLTLGLAIVGGLIAGFIASRSWFQPPHILFDDRDNFSDVKFPKINGNLAKFADYKEYDD